MRASWVKTAILLSLTLSVCVARSVADEAAGRKPRLDLYGDPLPDGAVKRFGSTRLRHIGPVLALAWSPDGKFLASSSQDRTIRLWDAATGRLVRSFPKGWAFCLAFTPDGKGLAAGLDGRVCVWEVGTDTELMRLDALSRKIRELADRRQTFRGPGGDLVDGVFYDERWSPVTRAIAFSADGRLLAAGGVHSTTVWDVRTSQKCFTLSVQHPFIAFTPDGQRLVTADIAKSVRIWDARTGKRTGGFETEGPERHANIFSLAVSPDGKHAALKLLNHLVIVELASGKVVWREKSYGYQNEPVAFSPDGRLLAFATAKGVRIWEWARGRQVDALREGGGSACVFSPDGKRLAWAWGDGTIGIWDIASRKETPLLERCPHALFALRPDGKAFVTVAGGAVRLWDTASGRMVADIPLAMSGFSCCLTFSRGGRELFLGDHSSTITVMDLSGEEKPRFHTGPLKDRYVIALAPEGARALATDEHSRITHLIGDAGRDWRERTGPRLNACDAAYTPDGQRLIVNGGDRLSYLDAVSGREIWRSEASPGRFNVNFFSGSLVSSPDGRLVAAGSEWQWGPPQKGCVRLYDADTGRERAKLATPYHCIHALAFSADSRFLIAASTPYPFASHLSADEASQVVINLWEVASGAEIHRFPGHEYLITTLAFAPDGRTFYSASADRTVLQWDAFGLRDASAARPGQADGLWADLADNDATKAYRAVALLIASPRQACALVDKHLQPTQAVSSKRVAELVGDLDSDRFVGREAAMRELRALGEQADRVLHETLQRQPSLEVRRRIEALREERRERSYSPDELQRCRAVLVLEWIGSAESRHLLERLARGTAAVSHVRDARAALKRLDEQAKRR